MSNFAETVKHFYFQGYPRVYDQGQLLNIESLRMFQPTSFHVHGLALPRVENLNQEEFGSVDDYDKWVRQVRFSFHLEGIEIWLYDMQNSSALIAPDSFWEAYNFYKNTIEAADIGSVFGLRITIQGEDTLAVRVITDGSDGWLEVFDRLGNNLGAARTLGCRVPPGSGIAWRATNVIREYIRKKPRFPPELS
ncbi:MAG: hypothetical protein RM368_08525 [Nostoc sp. DedSLP03]|uniref:hypothetical protein n=1 Tax=Nostoc sp. DedSLP03 TaxID=3075400 RepID=UPI002AD518BD|nr:hypothetical protein [Nostoc sp. DedSLP03]MDZ7965009.1 hypothetical protein [Nostoc sp. DedSLP03]